MRIQAKLAIVGDGTLLRDAVVVIRDTKIEYVGLRAAAPPLEDSEVRATWELLMTQDVVCVDTVMPGMWDCHCHLLGVRTPSIAEEMPRVPVAVAAARCTVDLASALNAGFTSVRELGGHGVELAIAVREGTLLGPRIYAAGSILSPTGGHADAHSLPTGCMVGWCDGAVLLCE